jgi:hypothetical protein
MNMKELELKMLKTVDDLYTSHLKLIDLVSELQKEVEKLRKELKGGKK